jgi:hypothetical protein
MEIYSKLQQARDFIKNSPVKKEGKNTYSGYEYFTPSQISKLVHDACQDTGLIHLYRLERNELGFTARLSIINTDKPEEGINFEIPTSIPEIKATNEAQKLGGAVTYSQRYLLMIAFDIVDNSLDFDTTENTIKTVKPAAQKVDKKTKTIPEIKDFQKFCDGWDGELNGYEVNWKGEVWTLSEKAKEQLETFMHDEYSRIEIIKRQVADERGLNDLFPTKS